MESRPPNENPSILIIGVGSIGERHLRCFQASGRCNLAFCEPIEERRREIAEKHGTQDYPSLEVALEDQAFDAALIASPAPYHIPTAQTLAERGIHLLIEKPLSLTMEGIDKLVSTVCENDVRVAVGYMYRSLPVLQQFRAVVQSGNHGQPIQVQVHAGQHFPFYRPAYRQIYYANPMLGGGLIQDMLPHSLNLVEWLVGPTTRVVADAEHRVLPGVMVEDTLNLLTRHGDVMGNFLTNQHQPVNEFSVTVYCSHGATRWTLDGQRLLTASENGGDWTEEESHEYERDDYYIFQANAFLDTLAYNATPPCSLADGIRTLRSTLAILESRETGKWVDVPQ